MRFWDLDSDYITRLFDIHVLLPDEPRLAQTFAEGGDKMCEGRGRRAAKKPDHGYHRPLRVPEMRRREKSTCKAANE